MNPSPIKCLHSSLSRTRIIVFDKTVVEPLAMKLLKSIRKKVLQMQGCDGCDKMGSNWVKAAKGRHDEDTVASAFFEYKKKKKK
jgi:hypothetical protein